MYVVMDDMKLRIVHSQVELQACADPEGEGAGDWGSGPPLENYKATKPVFNVERFKWLSLAIQKTLIMSRI